MKLLTKILLFTIALLTVTGCNDEVFVDTDILDTPDSLVVIGDNGSQALNYTRKKLHSATLLASNEVNRYLRFYDANGEEMEQLNLQELRRIVYDYDLAMWEITIESERIVIHSYENATGCSYAFQIILDYGDIERWVNVEILPGELPVFDSIESDASVISENVEQWATYRMTAISIEYALPVKVKPYAAAQSLTKLELSGPIQLHDTEIYVPQWNYNGTIWVQGPDIPLGSSGISYYFSPYTDRDLTVDITVPAGARQIITAYSNYIIAKIPCVVKFKLPMSGRKVEEYGTLTVANPMDYFIKIEDDK